VGGGGKLSFQCLRPSASLRAAGNKFSCLTFPALFRRQEDSCPTILLTLHVLYENEFQNPQNFHQPARFSYEQSTLGIPYTISQWFGMGM
jgi:hypothetical protein